LVAAAVAVAAIAAYFYVKNVKDSSTNAAATANQTNQQINKSAMKYANLISDL
jgi:NADH:ubiquinone oxidoreductase subunit 2 (subunit N)